MDASRRALERGTRNDATAFARERRLKRSMTEGREAWLRAIEVR
jgi:hypothetical protein